MKHHALAMMAMFAFFLAASTVAQAKILGTTKYRGQTVQVSTGHNDPSKCYYRVGGGSWQSAPWSLCAKLGARR